MKHLVRQAIVTKFIGPTNTRPSRIKVTCDAATRVFSSDEVAGNHATAAKLVAFELKWTGKWYQGALPNTESWNGAQVFVNVDGKDRDPAFEVKA